MKRLFKYWLLVSMFVSVTIIHATSESDIDFLLTTLSQDKQHNTVLSGFIDFDAVPSKFKKNVESIGYKPGDLVPAQCVLPTRQSTEGMISILVSPAKDEANKKTKKWKKIGTFHPVLFDSMDKWQIRHKLKDPDFLEEQIAALKNPSFIVRTKAVKMLGQIQNERTVEPLIAALDDENPDVRKSAIDALSNKNDERVLKPLIGLLKDRNNDIQDKVEKALPKISRYWAKTDAAKEAVPDFIAALNDTSSVNSQKGAAFALGRIEDFRAVEPLIFALKNADGRVRQVSAWALGTLKDSRAVEPLIDALKDNYGNGNVRQNATEALGNIQDSRTVEKLIVALQDSSWRVQASVISALNKNDREWINTDKAKQSVPEFIETLQDTSAVVRKSAVYALGKIQDPRGVEPLIVVLKDKDHYVRMSAASALGSIKDSRAVEPLIDALQDENTSVQRSAAYNLGEIEDLRAIEPLIDILKNANSSFVREAANKALEKITNRSFSSGSYESWNNWWTENKEDFLQKRQGNKAIDP